MNKPLAITCVPAWVEAAAADPAGPAPLPRFTMAAYNGGPMRLSGWRHPVVVDLAGMQIPSQARPIRLQHDAALGVGHTTAIRIEAGALLAEGVISRDTSAAREVVVSGRNGFPWQASIGTSVIEHEFVREGAAVEVNGRQVAGPVNVVRRSVLGEISFVDLGADGTTSAAVAASCPNPAPVAVHEDQPMLTAQILASMVAANPTHHAVIAAEAQKPDATEDSIKAALATAELQAAKDGRSAAEAALVKAQGEHAEAIKAKDAEIGQLKAELTKAQVLAGLKPAHRDPGPGTQPDTVRRSQMSRAEKAAYQREHGAAAYQRLPE